MIGVEDPETGEAVVAYVKPTAAGASDDLRRRRTPALRGPAGPVQAAHGDPRRRELPYTPTGKVQKGRLRATERRRALGLLE